MKKLFFCWIWFSYDILMAKSALASFFHFARVTLTPLPHVVRSELNRAQLISNYVKLTKKTRVTKNNCWVHEKIPYHLFLHVFPARSFVVESSFGPKGHFQIINRCTMGTQFSLPLFAFSIPISSNHKWSGEINVLQLGNYKLCVFGTLGNFHKKPQKNNMFLILTYLMLFRYIMMEK